LEDDEPSAGRGPRSGTAVGAGISPSWLGDFDRTTDEPTAVSGTLPTADPPAHPPSRTNIGIGVLADRRTTRPPKAPQVPRSVRRSPRGPAAGLSALVLSALLSAFIAWVTAEPFWLAVRHAEPGTATVTSCAGTGLGRRCTGTFTSADGGFQRAGIPITGAEAAPGTATPAWITSERGTRAFIDAGTSERAGLGIGLLLLCGLLTAWATGALRLPTVGTRLVAFTGCLVAPLLLFGGMLAATF
jgi:hypothetical protein